MRIFVRVGQRESRTMSTLITNLLFQVEVYNSPNFLSHFSQILHFILFFIRFYIIKYCIMSYINIKCYCFEACGKVLYSLKENYFTAFFSPVHENQAFYMLLKSFFSQIRFSLLDFKKHNGQLVFTQMYYLKGIWLTAVTQCCIFMCRN